MKQNFSMLYNTPRYMLLVIWLTLFGILQSADIPLAPVIKTIDHVRPIYEFKVSDTIVMSLAINRQSNFIIAGTIKSSRDKKFSGVSLWNKNEWNNVDINEDIFANHKLAIPLPKNYSTQYLTILEDNNTLIGQSDDNIWKWDLQNKKLIGFDKSNFLPIDQKPIRSVTVLPNQKKILVNQHISSIVPILGADHNYVSAKIFDLISGKFLNSLKDAHTHVSNFAVNPEGSLIGATLIDGSAIFWDAETTSIIKKLNTKSGTWHDRADKPSLITGMDISKKYIAVFGMNNNVTLMSLKFEEVKKWIFPKVRNSELNIPSLQIEDLKITPNEKFMIFKSSTEGWLGIIDIDLEKIVKFRASKNDSNLEWPSTFIISSDSKFIITGDAKGMVKIFDIEAIIKNKPVNKPELDLNTLKNSLMQITSILGSLSLRR